MTWQARRCCSSWQSNKCLLINLPLMGPDLWQWQLHTFKKPAVRKNTMQGTVMLAVHEPKQGEAWQLHRHILLSIILLSLLWHLPTCLIVACCACRTECTCPAHLERCSCGESHERRGRQRLPQRRQLPVRRAEVVALCDPQPGQTSVLCSAQA